MIAAALSLRAVWKWEQTHVIVTDDRLALVRGTLRRRTAAVRFERVGAVEIDQSLLGRALGYGTVIAGPLEITYVPQPRSRPHDRSPEPDEAIPRYDCGRRSHVHRPARPDHGLPGAEWGR
jgi:hypothetical protein